MALTRGGVAYNLTESPHKLEVPYEGETLTFVFSSALYKKKFYERFIDNRLYISDSLSRRFGVLFKNDILSDIRLYVSIEKRGFLILRNGDKFECQEDIILDGEKLMKRS